jgi:chromosome segregation protein
VADAVLWVLGEQSPKAVRARKPEEVIFAGSATRQPLGMAEVSLLLDNSDSSLPIEFEEVRVTRRLYRSGDSEYLLNGSKVRLKDITQLLLHAGLSPDSYTVIGQGSIDELILQRADERRVVFENVADIRRHQLRLNDTRSKLTSTDANLVRVQDVLAELTPHVRRLKVQADRSERAEAFRAELHDLLLRSFQVRLSKAHADRRQAEEDFLKATADFQEAEAQSLNSELALKAVDEQVATLDERFGVLRPRGESFREQARVTERSLAVTRERMTGLGEQRANVEAELARLQGQLDRLTLDEEEAARGAGQASPGEVADEPTELAERGEKLKERTRELEAVQAERSTAQKAVEAAEHRIREAEQRLARTEQHLHSLQANLAVDEARQSDRDTRAKRFEEQLQTLLAEAADVEQRVARAQARLTAAAAQRTAAASQLDQSREELREASQQADRLQGALAALGAADLSQRDDTDLPSEWQDALRDLPVVGRARELAAQIRPIDLLLSGYLQRIVVLANDAAAREAHSRLSARLKVDAPAWAVLSMDGLLLPATGERPLEAVGDEGQSVLADWSRQVKQLEEQRSTAERRRRAAVEAVQSARDGVDEAEADERSARLGLRDEEARLAELRRTESTARNELQQLGSEHERSARAATTRAEERERATQRARATRDELSSAQKERDALAEALQGVDDRLVEINEQVGELRTEVAALEATAGRREAERAAREALHARIKAEITATASTRLVATSRLSQLEAQAADLTDSEVQLARDLEAMSRELAPIDEELRTAERRRADLVAERGTVEQRLAVLRAAERAAHESREARHVMAQRAADEVERLNTEINETAELEAEMTGGAAWAEQLRLQFDELAEPQASFDLEAARRRIGNLQRELRAVGGVAESVVDEYREMSERHDFLEHQSADLRAAMAELHTAAAELETHMRERFSEVFSATQTAFQDTFVELFGGGEARLVLTDPDDLLRTGIDIVARPPGKKMQGLLSLSGGERALTVVSLLFGLLKINPTPFCVLDEVDAALDEANVQRFANLLADFARRIQFIVVTHNRATMDKADAMYGVSMDAQGISHIFSVQPRNVAEKSRQPSAVSSQAAPDG